MSNEALATAVAAGDVESARTALQAGADVEWQVNDFSGTSLFIAAGQGNVEMVQLLLDSGADLHAIGPAHMTALHSAARDGQLETATLLVERGAPKTERILNDVLHTAQLTARSHPGIVSLLQSTRLKMASAGGAGGGLHQSAEAGDIAATEAALAGGVDVNGRDGRGMEPLSWAALRGHDAVATLLIEHGADVNRLSRTGWPPIGQACGQGHVGMVRILLERGADVNIAFTDGRTALMCAAHQGHNEIVDLLLEAGADRAVEFDGQTAESLARGQGHARTAARLASTSEDEPDRITPLDDAARAAFAAGQLDEASRLMQAAVNAGLEDLSLFHSHTLSCVRNLAVIMSKNDDVAGAQRAISSALDKLEAEPQRVIDGRGMTRLVELASTCADIQDEELEGRCHQRIVQEVENSFGVDHVNYAAALNNFAEFCRKYHRYDEAMPLYEQVIQHSATPPPGKAIALNNMALVHAAKGKHGEAITLLRESIDLKVEALGPNHPAVVSGQETLAGLLAESGAEPDRA